MFKITPNPPETDDVSPYETPDSKKLNEAAERPRLLPQTVRPQAPSPHEVYPGTGPVDKSATNKKPAIPFHREWRVLSFQITRYPPSTNGRSTCR